jgi:hypothetical protein
MNYYFYDKMTDMIVLFEDANSIFAQKIYVKLYEMVFRYTLDDDVELNVSKHDREERCHLKQLE